MAQIAGKGAASSTTGLSGGTSGAGRDFIDSLYPVTQNATLESFDIFAHTGTPTVKIKIWRPNGANYDFIGQSETFILASGLNTGLTLATPISVQTGDYIGVHVASNPSVQQVGTTADTAGGLKWTGGSSDFTTSQPQSSFTNNFALALSIVVYGTPSGGGNSITPDALPSAVIRDRTNGNIDVSVSGSYTGTPTSIRRQVHYADDNSVVAGFEWATYIASPTGGTFSGAAITLPSSSRGYFVRLDFSNDAATTADTNDFIAADKIIVYGESLARDMETDGADVAPTASKVFYMDETTGALSVPAAGSGNITLANTISAHTGLGVIVATSGSGGMAMLQVNNNSNYLHDPVTPTANYNNVLTAYNAVAEPIAAVLLVGANDAYYANSTPAQYQQVFADHFAQLRSDTRADLPIFASLTGKHLTAPDSNAYGLHVYAQKAAYDSIANLYYVTHYDLPLQDDVHLAASAAGYGKLGERLANAIIDNVLGGTAAWLSPRIQTAVQIDATHTELTLDLGDGTDVSAASAITGLTLSDDGGTTYAVSVTDVSGSATNKLTVTHANTTPTNYRFLFGSNPNTSSVLLTNGLPLMQSEGSVTGPSTLNLSITGIPDGTYKTWLVDSNDTLIHTANLTYTSGATSVQLFVPAASVIRGFVDDGGAPPTNGAVIYGTTV